MRHAFLVVVLSIGFATNAQAAVCHTNRVTGMVVGPHAIKLAQFDCVLSHAENVVYHSKDYRDYLKLILTMNVSLRSPDDAAKMKMGKFVTLKGDFRATRVHDVDYLSVTDAVIVGQ
jgi:hypothetical protein